MIHHWECKRCTHQWMTSCMGEMLTPKEERERNHRQLKSDLCWDCFEQLEAGEIRGLELFDLFFYLSKKYDRITKNSQYLFRENRGTEKELWFHHWGYSGQTKEEVPMLDMPWGKSPEHKHGKTFEQDVLSDIVYAVEEAYEDLIKQQRTEKRIELDEWQEKNKKENGFIMFGHQERPEGFEDDPPGKGRFELLGGVCVQPVRVKLENN